MFNWLTKSLAIAILGLCGWIWFQSQNINSLKAENQTQAQALEQQRQVNKQLNNALQIERESTLKQTALEQKEKVKADDEIKVIYRTIYKDNCANQRMPDDVINILQHNFKH